MGESHRFKDNMDPMRFGAYQLSLWVTLLCCWHHAASDTLDVIRVKCIHPSTGSPFDELMIYIDDKKVYPRYVLGQSEFTSNAVEMKAGKVIFPSINTVDFDGRFDIKIQLKEYDWGSGDDDLGSTIVTPDVPRWQRQTVTVSGDGGEYEVSYYIKKNDYGRGDRWMLCGTAKCKDCGQDECCRGTSNSGLDRDGDKEDLKDCPENFYLTGWKTYPQLWPFEDVLLRVCQYYERKPIQWNRFGLMSLIQLQNYLEQQEPEFYAWLYSGSNKCDQ